MANVSEGFQASQTDTRTLGTLQSRVLDDLNRPDLSAQALSYIQDTIRYYQTQPWLWNETDNTVIAFWQPTFIYPQGSTIQVNVGGTLYAMVALNTGTSGAVIPTFPATIFTVPSTFPPPPLGTPGTVVDNTITWANAGLWSSVNWTQLSTVYFINQYAPFFGYQTPVRFEITTANLRLGLDFISYDELRSYDVISPPPITAYPRMAAWFQQMLYLWPYPNGFFPITLSGRWAPPIITAATSSNFWTTIAEPMIRAYTEGRMALQLLHDREGAADFLGIAQAEERKFKSLAIQQRSPAFSGIPPTNW